MNTVRTIADEVDALLGVHREKTASRAQVKEAQAPAGALAPIRDKALQVAEACGYLADHMADVEDGRSPAEKIAEAIAITTKLAASGSLMTVVPQAPGTTVPTSKAPMEGGSPAQAKDGKALTPPKNPDLVKVRAKDSPTAIKTNAGDSLPSNWPKEGPFIQKAAAVDCPKCKKEGKDECVCPGKDKEAACGSKKPLKKVKAAEAVVDLYERVRTKMAEAPQQGLIPNTAKDNPIAAKAHEPALAKAIAEDNKAKMAFKAITEAEQKSKTAASITVQYDLQGNRAQLDDDSFLEQLFGVRSKEAGDELAPAHVSGKKADIRSHGVGQYSASATGKGNLPVPSSGNGNEARSTVLSTQALIDATKETLHGPSRKTLGEVLQQTPRSPSAVPFMGKSASEAGALDIEAKRERIRQMIEKDKAKKAPSETILNNAKARAEEKAEEGAEKMEKKAGATALQLVIAEQVRQARS